MIFIINIISIIIIVVFMLKTLLLTLCQAITAHIFFY